MKSFLLITLVALATSHARGQSYSLGAATIAAGGGVSSGTGPAGSFSVTSTVVQQAWTAASGGVYAVSGGMFSQYYALQTEGAPALIIRRNGANVELVWGSNVPGWVLQWNSDLAPANWTDVAEAPSVSGLEQFHAFPLVGGRVFYRLRKR